jgi:hypothetical protein
MARQQRSTTFAQESTRPITQVALYARVSTLNNQDPEMQLAELREYAGRRREWKSDSANLRFSPANESAVWYLKGRANIVSATGT